MDQLRLMSDCINVPCHDDDDDDDDDDDLPIAHEFRENCHSVTNYFMKKDSKRCCDTTTPESIHTKDKSKRGSAFAFILGVN